MIVTLEEMKQYLRVDYEDDDQLITDFITSAEQLCRDVLRVDEEADLSGDGKVKTAAMYAVAYLYEHREEADHHDLILTLRSLLFGFLYPRIRWSPIPLETAGMNGSLSIPAMRLSAAKQGRNRRMPVWWWMTPVSILRSVGVRKQLKLTVPISVWSSMGNFITSPLWIT